MDAGNSNNLPDMPTVYSNEDESPVEPEPVNKQGDQVEVKASHKKRRRRSHKRASTLRPKKAQSTACTAKEGIMTGSDFVIPPELVRLRKSSLVSALPSSISRYGLN